LMVGDTGYDLQMANNAGIASLAVSYGSQSLEQLKEFNPLAIIESTYDLFDWIRING
jgi:phosphoglycolate phosphatase